MNNKAFQYHNLLVEKIKLQRDKDYQKYLSAKQANDKFREKQYEKFYKELELTLGYVEAFSPACFEELRTKN